MTATQLKNFITRKISKIDDEHFLNAIKVIIETKESSGIYIVNEKQKKLLIKSRKEYKEGKVHSNEHVFKDARKWLKEK